MHFRRRCDRQEAGYGERLWPPPTVTGEESQLRTISMKSFAGFIGGSAILVACGLSLGYSGDSTHNVAGGSGDSSTGGVYASPTVPAMKVDPTDMSMGATATFEPPAVTMATSFAAPTVKAQPAAGCVNNGQCP
jgi:hypothetical protein